MAAQRRKKTSRRRGASRQGSKGAPAFAWFLAGVLIGLGISVFLFMKGYLPDRPDQPKADVTARPEAPGPALIDESEDISGDGDGHSFDFFTVLPEMEVIVPDQELYDSAGPADGPASDAAPGAYILQVGSFRKAADAEQMKARLALLGIQAAIQVVTVNGETWHRVRVGPVLGARNADELRRQLQEQDYPALVMKDSS